MAKLARGQSNLSEPAEKVAQVSRVASAPPDKTATGQSGADAIRLTRFDSFAGPLS